MKRTIAISIDEDIHKKSKELGLNVSGEVEHALRNRVYPMKKDLPEENLAIKCSLCVKEIKEGYYCKDRKLVLCLSCQKDFKMSKCKYEIIEGVKQHAHIKFPSEIMVKPAENTTDDYEKS